MPIRNTTYGELYSRQLNILRFRNDYWAVADIHTSIRQSVKKYEQFNFKALKFLRDKEAELIAKHVEHSEGKPLWEESGNSQGYRGANNMVPVFIDAEHARDFNEAWNELLQQPCQIVL